VCTRKSLALLKLSYRHQFSIVNRPQIEARIQNRPQRVLAKREEKANNIEASVHWFGSIFFLTVWSDGCKVWGCLIMFGCFVTLWEVERFFKKELYGLRVGCIEVWMFLRNYGLQNFFQKFRGPYVKIHRNSGIFECIVMKFEVLFGKLWTANIFSRKFRGSCKIMSCKHIFLKVYGLICKNLWTAIMIFAKWNVFFANDSCSAILGCSCGRSDGRERPAIICRCSINLCEIEAFLSLFLWVGCIEVCDFLIMGCKFFQIFIGSYVEIRQWGFRGFFWKLWIANIFSR
jgi:hypothetical protein